MKLKPLLLAASLIGSFALTACQSAQTPVKQPAVQPDDSAEKPLGTEPVLNAEGVPLHCEMMVDGLCYLDTEAACAAATCPIDRCVILRTYPGQVSCQPEAELPADE